ncbi:hypothetical protein AX16_004080 [Volvariella volvacea WC 439]|nr:hypothetical protein AX16_004080 [Volvariella volvacea WC 439]
MYFDLYVPIPQPLLYLQQRRAQGQSQPGPSNSKKQKGKQKNAGGAASAVGGTTGTGGGGSMTVHTLFTPAQLISIERRVDMLVHCQSFFKTLIKIVLTDSFELKEVGYTVLGLTQTIHRKLDSKTHINTLDVLMPYLEQRLSKFPSGTQKVAGQANGSAAAETGNCPIVFLKRLNIVLDDESEKGIGLAAQPCSTYDILSLTPTTPSTLSLACLTHTLPSQLTTHIISLPLSSSIGSRPAAIAKLKHTLVRTTKRNGAVFEIGYAGAMGGMGVEELCESELETSDSASGLGGPSAAVRADAKRSWWAAAREVVRLTKGTGVIVSGAVGDLGDLRAPRDVGNLVTLLGLTQDQANDALTKVPKNLALRSQTRKTYRAVLSEPRLVISTPPAMPTEPATASPEKVAMDTDLPEPVASESAPTVAMEVDDPMPTSIASTSAGPAAPTPMPNQKGQKRPRESETEDPSAKRHNADGNTQEGGPSGNGIKHDIKGKEGKGATNNGPRDGNGAGEKKKKRKKHRSVLSGAQ